MTKHKTRGLLTAALITVALSAAAQQVPLKKDLRHGPSSGSGLYSVEDGDKRWILYQVKIEKMQAELDAIQRKVDKEMVDALIGDLVGEKVLVGRDDLQWLALTEDKLIVNGRKQPKALHRKLSKKYIRKAGFGIFYGDPDGKKKKEM